MRALLFFIAICVAAMPAAMAQSPVIDISTSTAPVDVLTIQDVDFINALSPKWLFSIDLRIRGGVPASVNASMAITLSGAAVVAMIVPVHVHPLVGPAVLATLALLSGRSFAHFHRRA